MSETLRNLINGEWIKGSGAGLESRDPGNGELLAAFSQSEEGDVDAAISAASSAQKSWQAMPQPKRAEIIYRVAEIIRERKEELSQMMTREMGKPIAETRGDVQEAIDMAYYIAAEGRRAWGWTVPSELPNKRMYVERVPLGVCVLITPWNFPLAIPTWKSFPALVMGNTVVFKPAEDTPILATRFAEILEEAGLPKGVFNLVHGSGAPISDALVTDERVAMISFTGSSATGADIARKIAPLHKRYSMEMGGKNFVMMMPDGNTDLALEAILWCAFGTTGQRCTACSRLILVEGSDERLVTGLVERAKTLKLGHGTSEETEVAALVNEKAREKVGEYCRIGQEEDKATLLCGGKAASGEGLENGWFFEPTIFDNVSPDMRIAQEEIFGPVLSIIRVKTYEEAIEVANGVKYGLSGAIFTQDINLANRFQSECKTGLCYINAGTTGAEVSTPFGGVKATGNGHREGGPTVIEAFSELRSIFIDYSGNLQKAQIDNN